MLVTEYTFFHIDRALPDPYIKFGFLFTDPEWKRFGITMVPVDFMASRYTYITPFTQVRDDVLYFIHDFTTIVILSTAYFGLLFVYLNVIHGINLYPVVLISLFKKSEQEAGSVCDFNLLLNQVLLLVIIYLGIFKLMYSYPEYVAGPLVISALTTGAIILSFPAGLSLIFGAYIMNYLKGDSDKSNELYAGLFDLATLFGFFKRFMVQYLRYFIITVKITLLDKYVFSLTRGRLLDLDLARERRNVTSVVSTFLEDFGYCITYSIEFMGEVCNLFVIYYAQFGALVLILYWLLKSLYSTAWPIIKILWFRYKR